MALIEIDGLPYLLKMGGSFHGELLNNQMVDVQWWWIFSGEYGG